MLCTYQSVSCFFLSVTHTQAHIFFPHRLYSYVTFLSHVHIMPALKLARHSQNVKNNIFLKSHFLVKSLGLFIA